MYGVTNNLAVVQQLNNKVLSLALSLAEQITFNDLKIYANNFLIKIQQLQDNFNHTATILEEIEVVSSAIARKGNLSYLRNCFLEVDIFERKINQFLDRTISLTWVDQKTGEIIIFDLASTEAMYNHITTKTKGTGRFQISKGRKLAAQKAFANSHNERIKILLENGIKNRAEVFKKAIERWNKPAGRWTKLNFNNMTYKIKKDNKYTFYWHIPNSHKINWSKSLNKGNISEGYVDAVLNNRNISNKNLELSLKRLNNIISMNSIPAIVKGDIVWKEDGSIQFAVKTTGANTAAIGQYIAVAYYILAMPKLTPKEFLKKLNIIMKKNYVQADKILQFLFDSSKKEINKTFNNLKLKINLGY